MKIQGRSAIEIAEHYGISPNTARKDLSRAARQAKDLEVRDAELYRFIQGARLEQLLRGVWTDAVDGDIKAGEQARKYIADLTDLFGLKVPVRTEISGPDGGAIPFGGNDLTELSALIDIAGQPDAVPPALATRNDPEDADDEEWENEEEDGDRQ
ncbi:hypothetical protein [Streptomyces mexicanus]|uniref:hypothetical protein n=1 Tax=Streptomyces mexicanus TaxID=178566 RepID=UPI00364C2BA0